MEQTIDLTTLDGWKGLTFDKHSITVKACGNGYRSSELSEAVEVERVAEAVLAAGQHCWKFTIDTLTEFTNYTQNVLFTSNDVDYTGMRFASDGTTGYLYYLTDDNETLVYTYNGDEDESTWTEVGYRIFKIEVEQDVTTAVATVIGEKSAVYDGLAILSTSPKTTFKATNKNWDGTVQISKGNGVWTAWTGLATTLSDCMLLLRGIDNTRFWYMSSSTTIQDTRFSSTGDIYIYGNVNTLLNYTNPPSELPAESCFATLFYGCTGLIKAPELPATTLTESCYGSMFYGCTGLIKAPELPATTLKQGCYQSMFRGCTSLTKAPELPATTLGVYCYGSMFRGCTSLTKAPELPATTLGNYCYNEMFYGCTGLIKAPELPATTLKQGCYQSMFHGCTSIKLSNTQDDEYVTPYRIPTSGYGITATNALASMFTNTGGTFTGTPSINTTYYGAWSEEEEEEEETT